MATKSIDAQRTEKVTKLAAELMDRLEKSRESEQREEPAAEKTAVQYPYELENCLYRAHALAMVLSDSNCRDSLSEFHEARKIMDGLHWLLADEISRAQEAHLGECRERVAQGSA